MIDGLVQAADDGTPQGGPLSSLLSNIVLDELDKELEKRNLCLGVSSLAYLPVMRMISTFSSVVKGLPTGL